MFRGLGPAMYGVWVAALAACELVASIDLGVGWAITRQVARSDRDLSSQPFILSAGNVLIFIGLAGMFLLASLGLWMPASLGIGGAAEASAARVLIALAISYGGETLIGYTGAVLYGVRRFALVSTLQTVLAVLRTAGLLVLVLLGKGVTALAVWYALATWTVALAGYLAMASLHPAFRLRPGHFSAAAVKQHLEFSVSSQLTALATSVVWRAPTLLLGFIRGAAAIPAYHIGQRLPLTVYGIGWRVAEAAFPAASEHQDASSSHLSRDVLTVSTRWSLLLMLPFIVLMVPLAPWFVRLWLGATDAQVVAILRISAVAVFANMLGAAALHVLWGRGRASLSLAVMGVSAIAVVLLAWLLVPLYGAIGAAWSTLPAMALGSIVLLRLASRACRTSAEAVLRESLRGLIIPSVAAAALAYVLRLLGQDGGWLPFLATSATAATVFVVCFYFVGTRADERRSFAEAWSRVHLERAWEELIATLPRPGFLRSVRDLAANARYYVFDRAHTTPEFYDSVFSEREDPWEYASAPERGTERFKDALASLRNAVGHDRFGAVLEIGCAEGRFTGLLAPHCRNLIAVDISAVALGRARIRCAPLASVEFRQWDLLRDEVPDDRFDVVIAMDVADNFVGLHQLRVIRDRLANLTRPGGVVLVESTRTGGDLEDAWWRRTLHRGRWLNRYIARHPRLEVIDERLSAIAVQTTYRKH
jgi:O-antigen/teichoic acid export membrane protein/predicted O-methyltransferase YrrM